MLRGQVHNRKQRPRNDAWSITLTQESAAPQQVLILFWLSKPPFASRTVPNESLLSLRVELQKSVPELVRSASADSTTSLR